MSNNKLCRMGNRRTHQFNAMKIRIFLGLCAVLGASFISVRAEDNPAQAAARVVLLQKMEELDRVQIPPPSPATLKTAVEQPVKNAADLTGTVSPKAAIPGTVPAPTTPVAVPAAVAPALSHRLLSLIILSSFIPLLLLAKFLLRYYRGCSPGQDSTGGDAYNA